MTIDEIISATEEMLAAQKAMKEGKTVQYRSRCNGDHWADINANVSSWDPRFFEYRVKPEPREWWEVRNFGCILFRTESEASARRDRAANYPGGTIIHCREVL